MALIGQQLIGHSNAEVNADLLMMTSHLIMIDCLIGMSNGLDHSQRVRLRPFRSDLFHF